MIEIGNGFFIVERKDWGATVSPGHHRSRLIEEVWIHHSVTIAEDDGSYRATGDVVSDMKEIERIGDQRFDRFPYTFCVHPSGVIAEGAGWNFLGAHTAGHNAQGVGFCFIGNTNVDPIGTLICQAFAQLIKYGRLIGKLPQGVKFPTGGHRDTKQTACPGNNLYKAIPEIQRYADQIDKPIEEVDELMREIWWFRSSSDPGGVSHAYLIAGIHGVHLTQAELDAQIILGTKQKNPVNGPYEENVFDSFILKGGPLENRKDP